MPADKYSVVCIFTMTFSLFAHQLFAEDEFTSYLFAYFTGNNISQEAIRFALSDDGHTFKALNGNDPIIRSAEISATGGVRDPHILRGENDDYYMVVTDMVSANGWSSNRGLVLLKSDNLVDWTSSAVHIPNTFSKYASADRVWAPQVIYDPEVGTYMVYFAMRLGSSDRDKLYYSYADSTFTKLETVPEILYEYPGQSAIDADIIYKDSTYHLFFKTEGSGNGIKKATSDKLTEGYVLYDKYLQLTSDAVEGSSVFKLINSDTYVLMYDVYMAGRYEYALSTDLKNFSPDPDPISFDFSPRHGTVIPITETEKRNLNRKWNPTAVVPQHRPVHPTGVIRFSNGYLLFTGDASFKMGIITLYTVSGKNVFSHAVSTAGKAIRVPNLSGGVYQAVFTSDGGKMECMNFIVR